MTAPTIDETRERLHTLLGRAFSERSKQEREKEIQAVLYKDFGVRFMALWIGTILAKKAPKKVNAALLVVVGLFCTAGGVYVWLDENKPKPEPLRKHG